MKLADCEPGTSVTIKRSMTGVGPDIWTARQPPSIAMARAKLLIEVQAKRALRRAIKDRARAFALRPYDLEAIDEGLSEMSPRYLIQALKWVGRFRPNGDHSPINLRGAMLYARWSRRVANRRK
jgi:hypothetical protein